MMLRLVTMCWCVQLEEMRELSFRNVDVSDKAQAELKNARKRIDELNAEMSRLISQVTMCNVAVLQCEYES